MQNEEFLKRLKTAYKGPTNKMCACVCVCVQVCTNVYIKDQNDRERKSMNF